MALRGTLTHWKTRLLSEKLGIQPPYALGILEALWHATADLAPAGNIGRLPNHAIALEMFYQGDADQLIAALIESRHLEEHPKHRLIVHDWLQHADYNVRRKVKRRKESMIANDGTLHPVISKHDEQFQDGDSGRDQAPEKSCKEAPAAPQKPIAQPVSPDNPDMSAMVERIVMAHPRSLIRKSRFGESTYAQKTAVLKAMEDEAKAAECSPAAALDMILAMIERQAHEVPPERYQFFKDVEQYMNLHEYRIEPAHFNREDRSNGVSSGTERKGEKRVTPAEQRERDANEAIRQAGIRRYGIDIAGINAAGEGSLPEPDLVEADDGYVPSRMGGHGGKVRPRDIEGRVS